MKKIFLILVFVVSCSKDGPKFDIVSSEINLMEAGSSLIKMKRKEPENAPVFSIKTNPQELKKLSKKLVCGPVTLEGRSGSGTDILSFKISESEFPGLISLPSKASCRLIVKIDGKLNGAREKELPVKFSFDVNPSLSITRYIARQGGNVSFNADGEFLLERFAIKNTLNYPVGFIYFSNSYNCNISGYYGPFPNGARACGNQNIQVISSRIKLKGIFESMTGDFSSWISFVIQPGDEVTVEALAKSPLQLSSTYNSSDPFASAIPLASIALRQCLDIVSSQGLSMWGDFKQSREDLEQPSKFATPLESTQNLPEWTPKGC